MSKKTAVKADPEQSKHEATPQDNLAKIKAVASQFRNYVNQQYQDNVSYVPDAAKVAKVTVSKWVELGDWFEEAVKLPGLPMGNITHVYGKPDTGKTTLLMQSIAACQRQGILPILILTEHKFDFNRLPNYMGADPEAMLVFHADTIEQAYGFMEKILKEVSAGQITYEYENPDFDEDQRESKENQRTLTVTIDMTAQDCYILMDSIGNTLSESEMEYEVADWDKSMGKAAKALKNLTKRLNYLLGKLRDRCGILLLNQSYQSMPQVGPSVETPYGGDGVPYSCVLNIRFRRRGDLKATVRGQDQVVGLETTIQVMKNHVSHVKPISTVYTVATGMMKADKALFEAYKKDHVR